MKTQNFYTEMQISSLLLYNAKNRLKPCGFKRFLVRPQELESWTL